MAQETELKLLLGKHHVGVLLQHALFGDPELVALGETPLVNCYYDTADQQLANARGALRVRTKQDRQIQTLKTEGVYVEGIPQRGEWEWDVTSLEPDLSLLTGLPLAPELLNALQTRGVELQFRTDFNRTAWVLQRQFESGPATIEIVLDQGAVSAPGVERQDPICELELELKSGEPGALFELALELARWVPMMVGSISKGARGYRLLAGDDWALLKAKAAALPASADRETAFIVLMFQQLVELPRLFESWQYSRDWQTILAALECIREISALTEIFVESLLLDLDSESCRLLAKLQRQLFELTAWQRVERMVGTATPMVKMHQSQAMVRLDTLLQTREPGLLVLLLSHELSQRVWRKRWPESERALAEVQFFD